MKILPLVAALFLAMAQTVWSSQDGQVILPAGARPSSMVKSENFTGTVRVDPVFQAVTPGRSYGAYVTFEPGSRTNWHTHPLGQTLVVTAGRGLTQEWGKEPRIIRPGDVVVCPPDIKHWHGALPQTAMTHLAISEKAEGKATQWLEKVEAAEYEKGAEAAGRTK